MMEGLSTEEREFALSAEGQAAIARAKRDHNVREGWSGPNALAWTDGHAAAVVRRAVVERQRGHLADAAFAADAARRHGETVALRALADAAKAKREADHGRA